MKAEQLRAEHERLGRETTRLIADYVSSLDERPVCSPASPAELARLFDEPLPAWGSAPEAVLREFEERVLPHAMNVSAPSYFGQFNPTPLAITVWADALASAMNQNGAAWRNSPAINVIEARVIEWLCALIGYDARGFGTLTSGGSEANLIALKCARDRACEGARDRGLRGVNTSGDAVVYASDQCHYSFVKSVDILGIGRDNLRKIKTDERFHIRTDELRRAIDEDLAAGKTPVCIAGAAGSTSSGVIDPIDELARVAAEYDLWFHVDAAYGGGLLFSEQHREKFRGIERADSVTIDPHKWMFVPFACGAVLVRDGKPVLREGFDASPEYLSEERAAIGGSDVEYDFLRYGQLGTRRANALKIWMAIKTLGAEGYRQIVDRHIELTHRFAGAITTREGFEVVGEVETAVCCFRYVPEATRVWTNEKLDALQRAIQARIERGGAAWFATTVLGGRRVLRINVNSLLTEERHIDHLVELVAAESRTAAEELR